MQASIGMGGISLGRPEPDGAFAHSAWPMAAETRQGDPGAVRDERPWKPLEPLWPDPGPVVKPYTGTRSRPSLSERLAGLWPAIALMTVLFFFGVAGLVR